MSRFAATLMFLFCCCTGATAIVGDAPPAEWRLARPAVMVFGPHGPCSGAVLAQDLVLTAAHCVAETYNYKIVGHIAAAPFSLADVTEIAPHPQFSGSAHIADLAMLKLSEPLPTGFAPAFLEARPVAVGDRLIVVGYGVAVEGDRKSAGIPRMVELVVTNQSTDALTLGDQKDRLSACNGDSGAPVFARRGGVPALIGIVRGGQCGSDTVVTPLAPFRDWIAETAQKLGSPLAR